MAKVVAVTPIRFGKDDGSVEEFGVGDELSGFDDDQLRDLVLGGSAVEIGKTGRKFSSPDAAAAAAVDDDTRKRDALILQSREGSEEEGYAPAANTSNLVEDENKESGKAGK